MSLTVTPVTGMPQVEAGDDLVAMISKALHDNGIQLVDGDVLVVSSKIASKARGLFAEPRDRQSVIAGETEWVVAERRAPQPSGEVRLTRVVKSVAGPVMAGAGVDASNTGAYEHLLLLPRDPDAVCRDLHAGLTAIHELQRLGIVLSDTGGRAWRVGQTDFALGAHGVRVTDDLRGGVDADGRPLEVTTRAVADEIAAAGDLVKGKVDGVPVAHLRGLGDLVVEGSARGPGSGARSLVRTGREDWFGLGQVEAVRAALGVLPGSDLAATVGIASAAPETLAERATRAVATAIHALPEVGVDVGPAPGPGPGPGSRTESRPGTGTGSGPWTGRGSGSETGRPRGQPRAASRTDARRLVVTASDPFDVGMATARLLVAAWAEGLTASVVARAELSVTLDLVDRP
ncbi:MAG: coenzyme F420-0:L-glutamate ligase [Lapillicoccus sp.]